MEKIMITGKSQWTDCFVIKTYNALPHAEKYLLKDNKKKYSKALFYIFQGVHERIFLRIAVVTK
jgi:hypothetical protein